MPIQFEIFHPDRIVVLIGRGTVTLEEFAELIGKIAEEGGIRYRKILDTTGAASSDLTMDVLLEGDALIRDRAEQMRGPLAIVTDRKGGDRARAFKELSTDRPVEVFGSIHDARAWLRTLPTVD